VIGGDICNDAPAGFVALAGVVYEMTQPIARDATYRRCRFTPEIIETAVRWYISYRLSYRDLVELMAERGVRVCQSTLHRWVMRFVPEYERRWNRRAKVANSSWRVDETFINTRPKLSYLYIAVDSMGRR
jgi:transposase-like protein